MIILDENSIYQRKRTDWGYAVRTQLEERGLTQQDIVTYLNERGFKIDKSLVSKLLAGIGVTTHHKEITAINEYLDIRFS